MTNSSFEWKYVYSVFYDIEIESLNGICESLTFITTLFYLCRDETHRSYIRKTKFRNRVTKDVRNLFLTLNPLTN